jgi:hypothetical protein
VPAGAVTAVAPAGTLSPGAEVTVSYAVAAATTPPTTVAPTTAPTPAQAPAPTRPTKTHHKKGDG